MVEAELREFLFSAQWTVARPGVAGPDHHEGWTEGLANGCQDVEVLAPSASQSPFLQTCRVGLWAGSPALTPNRTYILKMRKGGPERLNGLVRLHSR